MFASIISVIFLMLLVFFIFYKRDMVKQIFSIDSTTSPTQRFQEQLEQTADVVIKRLEEKINQLEYLLDEANTKITQIDNKIQSANKILAKENFVREEHLSQSISEAVILDTKIVTDESIMMPIDHYKDMGRNDKRTSIIEMADLGYDITEIAKATGISKGEIMLLLQLNKKNK